MDLKGSTWNLVGLERQPAQPGGLGVVWWALIAFGVREKLGKTAAVCLGLSSALVWVLAASLWTRGLQGLKWGVVHQGSCSSDYGEREEGGGKEALKFPVLQLLGVLPSSKGLLCQPLQGAERFL